MAGTDHYVVGDSSPFLKRVFIPFYIVRVLVMAILVVIYGFIVAVIAGMRDEVEKEIGRLEDEYNTSVDVGAVIAIAVVLLILIIFCLALDIVTIVKRARRTLSPRFFLIANVVQVVVWTVDLVLTVVGASSGVAVGISVIIYLSFVGMLAYAAVIFHRFRKGSLTYAKTGQGPAYPQTGFQPNANYAYNGAATDYYGKQQSYEMPSQYGYGQQPQHGQP